MSTTETPTETSVSPTRALATVIGTILIVVAEFGLLYGVYHRSQPIAQEQAIVARLSGQLDAGQGRLAAAQTMVVAHKLDASDVSTTSFTALTHAASELTANPADPGRVVALQQAVHTIQDELADRHSVLNREAAISYATLLVLASIGWMFWFKRLVARHRALQSELTAQQTLVVGEQRLAALIRNASDMVAVCEADSTVTFVTPSIRNVIGFEAEDVVGKRFTELVHPDDLDLCLHAPASPGANEDTEVTLRVRHRDGRILYVEGSLSNRLADPAVSGIVLTLRDITARRELENRLKFQAFHDSLTGMANRQLFGDRLEHALTPRPGGPSELVVLFCDLDDFKSVNDSYGHGLGDQILIEAGNRLRSVIRSGDTAARLGGDEFAVLMESTDMATAERIAERMQAALAPPVEIDERSVHVRASIGLAYAVSGDLTAEDVLRNADVAMYMAKDRGKSAIAVYEPQIHAAAMERLELRADLQRSLNKSDLVLHYQPTIDMKTGDIVGFEALVRWQHPTLGLLSPDRFIPMAEECGLILPLGAWVLSEACHAAAAMQRPGQTPKMSVNVSSQQLSDPGFVRQVLGVLEETKLPSECLVLEITETVVLDDLEQVSPRLAALRELGVRVAIDDFGTGYSSLAYLSSLPIDLLKVDKSFVDRVTTHEQDASLAEAIISLSHGMKFQTVAEGVEHEDQADWLRDHDVAFGQGYFWSRPVPLTAARDLLASQLADGRRIRGQAVVPLPANSGSDSPDPLQHPSVGDLGLVTEAAYDSRPGRHAVSQEPPAA